MSARDPKTPQAFINYRVKDTAPLADSIYRELNRELGAGSAFIDHRKVEPGEPYPENLEAAVRSAAVILALIGPNWLTVQGDFGIRRLDNPDDWVRREIEIALSESIPVIPILSDGATMPPKAAFRSIAKLEPFAELQWLPLETRNWDAHFKRLVDELETKYGFRPDAKAQVTAHTETHGTPISKPIQVTPMGIRSFGSRHRDFYPFLLTGSNADGVLVLPDSVKFWTHQFEPNHNQRFRVGCLWGRSGCGKTSFVEAALVPYLPAAVTSHIIRTRPQGTEAEVRQNVALFQSSGKDQHLIILDQFEQWMMVNPWPQKSDELVQLLGAADGCRLSFLLVYRDGLEELACRLFEQLGINRSDSNNIFFLDEFDSDHAQFVLRLFGIAYGRQNAGLEPFQEFIKRAVELLIDPRTGAISPLRLSVFAQMLKAEPWIPETLANISRDEKIVTKFIQTSFEGPDVYHERKRLIVPAKRLLQALLPPSNEKTRKDVFLPVTLLARCTGLDVKSSQFTDLIYLLDQELHLITPRTTYGPSYLNSQSPSTMYELTHDFLVGAVRLWVEPHKDVIRNWMEDLAATHQGSAPRRRICLWPWEFAAFRLFVRRPWSEAAERMMYKTQGTYLVSAIVAILCVVVIGFTQVAAVTRDYNEVADLKSVPTEKVPELAARLNKTRNPIRRWLIDSKLKALSQSPEKSTSLRASLALFARDRRGNAVGLSQGLLLSSPSECSAFVSYLARANNGLPIEILNNLIPRLVNARGTELLHLSVILGNSFDRLEKVGLEVPGDRIISALAILDIDDLRMWASALSPYAAELGEVALHAYEDPQSDIKIKTRVRVALLEWGKNCPVLLAKGAVFGDDTDLLEFVALIRDSSDRISASVEVLQEIYQASGSRPRAHARSAAVLFLLGNPGKLLEASGGEVDGPVTAHIIHSLVTLNPPTHVIEELLTSASSPNQIRLCLLVLGSLHTNSPSKLQMAPLILRYLGHDDPGVSAAAEWFAGRCNLWANSIERAAALSKSIGTITDEGFGRRQERFPSHFRYVTQSGKDLVGFIPPTSFEMGSRPQEPRIAKALEVPLQKAYIKYPFAVACKEVSVADMREFYSDKYGSAEGYEYRSDYSPSPEYPANRISWLLAMEYCHWLSKKDGIPTNEWVFPAGTIFKPPMKWPQGYLTRTGYRLPTEVEWEFVARANTAYSHPFGDDTELLAEYAANRTITKLEHMLPVGSLYPNSFGLFDTLGNALEWCLNPMCLPQSLGATGSDALQHEQVGEISMDSDSVMRGGSFYNEDAAIRVNYRYQYQPVIRTHNSGFRVARTLPIK